MITRVLEFTIPPTEGFDQIDQPEGLQAGSLNPPEPVGMPWGLTEGADISFSTSGQRHSGQSGDDSPADNRRASKQWQQLLHWYSYIGMGFSVNFFLIIGLISLKSRAVIMSSFFLRGSYLQLKYHCKSNHDEAAKSKPLHHLKGFGIGDIAF